MVNYRITPYLAKNLLLVREDGTCHCIHNDAPDLLIGCDCDYRALCEDLGDALEIRIAGEKALGMGHGIAVLWDDEPYYVFFEHKRDEMREYLELLEDVERAEKEYLESNRNCECRWVDDDGGR